MGRYRLIFGIILSCLGICLVGMIPATVGVQAKSPNYSQDFSTETDSSKAEAVCSTVTAEAKTVVAVVPGTDHTLPDGAWVYPGTRVMLIRCQSGVPASNFTVSSLPEGLELVEDQSANVWPVVQVTTTTSNRIDLGELAERGRTLKVRTPVPHESAISSINTIYFPPDGKTKIRRYADHETAFVDNLSTVHSLVEENLSETTDNLNASGSPTNLTEIRRSQSALTALTQGLSSARLHRQQMESILIAASWKTGHPSGIQTIKAIRAQETSTRERVRSEFKQYNQALRAIRSQTRTTLLVDFFSWWLGSVLIGFMSAWLLMGRGVEALRKDQRRSSALELGFSTLWYRRRGGYFPKAIVVLLATVAAISVILALIAVVESPAFLNLGLID